MLFTANLLTVLRLHTANVINNVQSFAHAVSWQFGYTTVTIISTGVEINMAL